MSPPPSRAARILALLPLMALLTVTALVLPGAASPAGASRAELPAAHPDWSAPSATAAPSAVLRRFDAPPAPWAAGHRGVDWASPEGTVLAPGSGTVRFAGPVAGRSVVTVAHPNGMLSSLEPVELDPDLSVGERITAGQSLGSVQDGVDHCARPCVHWGVRIPGGWTVQGGTWDRYVDPLVLLGWSGPSVLWPLTGRPPAQDVAP